MTETRRVDCINTTDRLDPWERIRFIGGQTADGFHWKLRQEDAIETIERGLLTFFVDGPDGEVRVLVAESVTGHKFLTTIGDGDEPKLLLSLPECT